MATKTRPRKATRHPKAPLLGHEVIAAATEPGRSTVDIGRKLSTLRAAWKAGALTKHEHDERAKPLALELQRAGDLETAAMRAALGPLGVTIGTPVVVAGELIESAWGNQVRTDLLALNTGKAELAGATFTGAVSGTSLSMSSTGSFTGAVTVGAASTANHAYRKTQVDALLADKLNLTGGTLTGTLAGTTFTASGSIAAVGNVTADTNIAADGVVTAGAPSVAGSVNGSQINYQGDGALLTVVNSASSATHSWNASRQGAGAAAVGQLYARFSRTASDTLVGSISIASSTTVAFNTSSDRDFKTRVAKVIGVEAAIQELGRLCYRGRYTADGKNGPEWVFLDAQDIVKHFPELVLDPNLAATIGEKEARRRGRKRDPLQVNFPGMVPPIVATLAVVLDRLEVIERKLVKA